MGKKYIPVTCHNRKFNLFCDDIRRVYYLKIRNYPPIPQYDNQLNHSQPIDDQVLGNLNFQAKSVVQA